MCICGLSWSILRFVFNYETLSRATSALDLFVYAVLGIITAVVVYIIFRAGFIAITDHSVSSDQAGLSPFIIAFAAVAAGLLSEQAVDRIRTLSAAWVGDGTKDCDRWANQAMGEFGTDTTAIAAKIGAREEEVKEWIQGRRAVPPDRQRDLSLVLDQPIRDLFSDIPPTKT